MILLDTVCFKKSFNKISFNDNAVFFDRPIIKTLYKDTLIQVVCKMAK